MAGRRRRNPDELGAHVSAAGGVQHAPARAAEIGSVVLQVFTKQPARWADPELSADDVAAFRAELERHRIAATAVHDSYLINLASHDDALRQRSLAAFVSELDRSARLGVDYVVTHPGNATDDDVPSALARNADCLTEALERVSGPGVLLETTAGTGRALGSSFEELAWLMERVSAPQRARVGVCIDTCHVWAAGYDIRARYEEVVQRCADVLGLDRIRLFHLNDSAAALGSRRDRHAHIGRGTIGDAGFQPLLADPRFAHVPKLLETPKDDDAVRADRRNLRRLRRLRNTAAQRVSEARTK